MRRRYTLHAAVRDDLKQIQRYIAERNSGAAARLRAKFQATFRMLASSPEFGESRPDLGPGVRMFTVDRYVLLYQPRSDGVRIIQVIHHARDLEAVFRPLE
jgi:toxin ParE1/3/4